MAHMVYSVLQPAKWLCNVGDAFAAIFQSPWAGGMICHQLLATLYTASPALVRISWPYWRLTECSPVASTVKQCSVQGRTWHIRPETACKSSINQLFPVALIYVLRYACLKSGSPRALLDPLGTDTSLPEISGFRDPTNMINT